MSPLLQTNSSPLIAASSLLGWDLFQHPGFDCCSEHRRRPCLRPRPWLHARRDGHRPTLRLTFRKSLYCDQFSCRTKGRQWVGHTPSSENAANAGRQVFGRKLTRSPYVAGSTHRASSMARGRDGHGIAVPCAEGLLRRNRPECRGLSAPVPSQVRHPERCLSDNARLSIGARYRHVEPGARRKSAG